MQTINIEKKNGYAIIQIDNGKVNAINTLLLRDLKETFLNFDKDDDVKGIILTGRPHCFSAGIDIISVAQQKMGGMDVFWGEFIQALQAMVRFSKPYVCAITGYAPAGGTILTCTADYRIMAKGAKHKIGMHEFKMSLQIPEILCDIFAYTIGEKRAWEAVQKIELFSSDEALAIGLVNESVEVEEVLPRAEAYLQNQIKIYHKVHKLTKQYLRKGLLEVVDVDVEKRVAAIIKDYNDPEALKMMKMFVGSLQKK